MVSYARLNYGLQRRNDQWRIASLDSIYEHTTLTPAVPGELITIPAEQLAEFRASYSILAWDAWRSGRLMIGDLLGDDRPEPVAAFYTAMREWLEDEPAVQ